MKARIEEWSIVLRRSDPYKAPELVTASLSGKVFGHEKFPSGMKIFTSAILGKTKDGSVKTESGTLYELGVPASDYEDRFPGALKRVLNNLPELEE